MAAALDLVREVGYDAASMEAIAARARVGKATLYRWWPSRELLVAEAIGHIVAAIAVPDTGSVHEDVTLLMRVSMRMYADAATGPLLSGLVATMARHDAVAAAVRGGFVRRWRHAMRVVLRAGIARGELRPDADLHLLLDLLSGPLFYRYLMLGRPIKPSFVRAVVSSVLRAFQPVAEAPSP